MNISKISIFPVACILATAGLFAAGCSDDNNPAAPAVQYGWAPLGTGMSHASESAVVRELAVYGDKLIAGGRFTTAGGVSANNIAAWDGSTWSPLGAGLIEGSMATAVYALTVYNNTLIAGGNFTNTGGTSVNFIAQWDGSAWSPLGTGMNASVLSLTVYGDKLIAGGGFTTAGGANANKIAVWDGSTWSPIGTGMNSSVYALTIYDDKWIAAGEFSTAGGVSAKNIAAWDGSTWSPLGTGMSFPSNLVRALDIYENKLIVGGIYGGGGFDGGTEAWDGSTWSPLEEEPGDSEPMAGALTVYNDRLIAGGSFTTTGSDNANNIAAWNGSAWSSLGTGTDDYVAALAVYVDKLIAGGFFITAGGDTVNCIAAWGPK